MKQCRDMVEEMNEEDSSLSSIATENEEISPTKNFKSCFARAIVTELRSTDSSQGLTEEDHICSLERELRLKEELWLETQKECVQMRKETQRLVEENRKLKSQVVSLNQKVNQLQQNSTNPDDLRRSASPVDLNWCLQKAEASRHLYEMAVRQVLRFLEQIQKNQKLMESPLPSSPTYHHHRSPSHHIESPRSRKRGSYSSPYLNQQKSETDLAARRNSSLESQGSSITNSPSHSASPTPSSSGISSYRSQSPNNASELAIEAGHLIGVLRRLVDAPKLDDLTSIGSRSLPSSLHRRQKSRKLHQEVHWV